MGGSSPVRGRRDGAACCLEVLRGDLHAAGVQQQALLARVDLGVAAPQRCQRCLSAQGLEVCAAVAHALVRQGLQVKAIAGW